jgi:hypothetical protein
MESYRNPGPVAYQWDEPLEPVPGWGRHPKMAGDRRVGVGGLGVDPTSPGLIDVVWPLVQPKIRAELDRSIEAAIGTRRRDSVIMVGITIASVFLAAWWVKRR